MPKIHHDVFEL